MRRRNSVSSASGTFTRNGRIALVSATGSLPSREALRSVMVYSFGTLLFHDRPRGATSGPLRIVSTSRGGLPLHLQLHWFRVQRQSHPWQLFIRRHAVALDDTGWGADGRAVRRDIVVDDEGIRPHLGVIADANRSEENGVGSDEHVVAHAWMPSATVLSGPAQRDVVEHDTVVADRRRLADHDAGAVIEEEPLADRRARVDLHAGPEASHD